MSELEELLAGQIRLLGLPEPEREYRFAAPKRKFRADFAWPERMVIAECEGGLWVKSRHRTGKGFLQDCIKYNMAAELGWTVYRYPAPLIESGEAAAQLERVLKDDQA